MGTRVNKGAYRQYHRTVYSKLTKRQHTTATSSRNTSSTSTATTATTKVRGIKWKISGNTDGEVELNQNTLCE